MGCLDENTIVALGTGRLSLEERQSAAAHIDACPDCRALLAAWGQAISSQGIPATASPHEEALPQPEKTVEPGSRLGPYLVLYLLGAGGMGVVYAAYDTRLDRRVALKLLRRDRFAGVEQAASARLLGEAKAVARLNHPHVITLYDVGLLDDQVFLAMEFVEGGTLSQWLREKPRTWREVLEVFLPAGQGLAAAHAAGLVHRDFKPDNVLVGQDGRVRVTDFGLARSLEVAEEPGPRAPPVASPAASVTHTGAAIGTPAYMSPEQLARSKATARSDQFSFCVALHEALFGERPFDGTSREALRDPPKDSAVPPWLRRVLIRGLSLEPSARHPSMDALLEALEQGPRRERRKRFMLGATVVLGIGAAAAVLLWPLQAREVLYNGDTEESTNGWSCDHCVQSSASSPSHGGQRSLHVTQRDGPWAGPQQDVRARLLNGATYQSEVWVRLASGATEAMATLELVTDTRTDYVTLTLQVPVDASHWAQLSGTALVSWTGTLRSARWYVETESGTQDFYLDDARFFPLARSITPTATAP
ncbi:protein kinase domain-containing protein [Hyalangium versicolor]|uniref:protein kinase domain-containing protein n=1 Tax=Hyalangium versicolor TaxID=2861190 RepID=UPI001CCBF154|nr:protein kinase [Hyalangium versicolor]